MGEDDGDQAGLSVSQGWLPSFFNYSSNWYPRADTAAPESPGGAPQFQSDVSFNQ